MKTASAKEHAPPEKSLTFSRAVNEPIRLEKLTNLPPNPLWGSAGDELTIEQYEAVIQYADANKILVNMNRRNVKEIKDVG
jgi:hypothetical protein